MAKDILPVMMDEMKRPQSIPLRTAAKQLQVLWKSQDGFGDTWDDAKLRDLARYLLGAKGLRVPAGWEWIIPERL